MLKLRIVKKSSSVQIFKLFTDIINNVNTLGETDYTIRVFFSENLL